MAVAQKFATLTNLNGGLATRPTPLLVEAGLTESMKSPALRNVDFFTKGSIAKRLGKTIQGDGLTGPVTAWKSQLTNSGPYRISSSSGYVAISTQFVAPSTANLITVNAYAGVNASAGGTIYASFYTNVSGAPGALVTNGTSSGVPLPSSAAGSTTLQTFTFPTTPSLTSGVTYWLVIWATIAAGGSLSVGVTGSAAHPFGYSTTYSSGFSTWTNDNNFDMYYQIFSGSSSAAIQGIYDYRFGSASTQKVMGVTGGTLYYKNGSTWTSLTTGLGSGQDILYSFATLKDYLFTLDDGTNQGRVWNGSAAYTTVLGYRPTGTFARSASGGTVTTGTYKVLLVTTLKSGGFRSSVEYTITTTSTTDKIAATAVAIDGTGATDFGFDINATATKVFMTTIGGLIYYKVPAASISTGVNPLANNTTSFNITAPPTGLENTLLDEYGLLQAYFTTQTASPTGKYLAVFQNMMAMGGDATNPSRVWFSGIADGTSLAGPQIWGLNGGLYGNYRDLNPNDGEVLVGLKEWNGNLYAFKRHSVFVISFTGVAGNPFEVRRLTGNIGCLSHWSIKETQRGLVFISERGPAICTGTNVQIIPSAIGILDRFDLNETTSYNLSAMSVTTGGNNSTKQQIHWGVSSHSATTRDITLVYDYENDAFWENDVSANYYTEVTDSNFFPSVWSGDYSAQVFRHDFGTNDNGSTINFFFDTPLLQLGAAFSWKQLTQIFIAGAVQTSGTLTVDIFLENSTTSVQTLTYDMTRADFKSGQSVSCGLRGRMFRLRLSNSALDVPVEIDSIMLGYNVQGSQF